MASKPQYEAGAPPEKISQLKDDDIVISGISGLFPNCNSTAEFSDKLYKHENLVSNKNLRWNCEHPELRNHVGTVPGLETFDAQFFMVNYHLSHSTDPMSRKLLEQAYQAMFDAGISHTELSGKKVGVFIGTSLTETDVLMMLSTFNSGIGIIGANRAMFSNRISYWLNAKGPSMTIDSSCSSAMAAMEKAYEAMSHGECDAAIVGGCNIHLNPQSCIHYERLFGFNKDGKNKCFDKNADGPSAAECISVIFLQKARDAKRVYATVCNVKTQFGKTDGGSSQVYGPYRNPSLLSSFYDQFYKDSKVLPLDVEYVEAFGSALSGADKKELEAIQEVFCKNRNDPLLIGSVVSNMGFSSGASTAAAITKVCLAYQTGQIAANLHYETPHNDVPAISDGRMHVVTDNRPFKRSYAAINSLSVTGINGHLLLKGQYKPKDTTRYESRIPYLLTASGRQESAVQKIFVDLLSHPLDPELFALLHNIHKNRIPAHLARGFAIMTSSKDKKALCMKEKVDYYDDAKKPLWFVYSGMGSQWNGMGRDLLNIPLFAAAIERCQAVLEPKGVNLVHILTSDDKNVYQNILNSFVGIAAVQIGLTDVLISMGLVPDNIIGHSVGELGCAYADGCLTLEEMILAAYYRGLVSVQTPFIKGAMAAVGLGWQQVQEMCPPEIVVACHNSSDSSTISGPAEIMRDFVAKLTEQGIFAKEVPSSNIAFHSRYIADAGPGLLKHLKTVMKDPKRRSERWLSTSVPKAKWDEPSAQICSAEYHTNNLLNSVLFDETSKAIPADAVLIEVAPHGLLQAILKRSLPPTCVNVPLTRRGHPDNVMYFLEAIGKLFLAGYNPDVSVLYPKVEFPVSTETRSLAQMVEWAHDETWRNLVHVNAKRIHTAEFETKLSTYDDEFSFLKGHIICGETIFPLAGILVFVWDTLAMAMGVPKKELSVQFRDVHFHTQLPIVDTCLMKFEVEIHRGTGKFEVFNEDNQLATGYIEAAVERIYEIYPAEYEQGALDKMVYTSNDLYRMLYDKGYGYRGEFRSIQNMNDNLTQALISWNNNWVTLIDAAIQMNILTRDSDVLQRPRFIQRLNIDVKQHKHAVETPTLGNRTLEAYYLKDKNTTRCGGVVLRNVLFTNILQRNQKALGYKTLKFVPNNQLNVIKVSTALNIILQILEENIGISLNVLDVTNNENGSYLYNHIKKLIPELNMKIKTDRATKAKLNELNKGACTPDFMLIDNLLLDSSMNELLVDLISPGTFVIVLEEGDVSQSMYKVVTSAMTPNGRLVLGRWRPEPVTDHPNIVSATSPKDIPFLVSARENLSANGRLYILTKYPPMNELKDLVQQWRKDSVRNKVHMAMISKTQKSLKDLQEKELPGFDLAYTVLHDGTWGGYYYVRGDQSDYMDLNTMKLRSAQIGNLDSLYWTETTAFSADDVVVSVHFAGLNFYDAKKATGDVSAQDVEKSSHSYGMDFSGLTARGERVMGLVRSGAASSQVSAEPTLLWPVPDHWSLEDAATVPLAYAHAFYCLGMKCELKPGMSVLVQGASGGLGQAIIAIALANQCKVFAAVSSIKKKQLLRKIFPELPDAHIGCSRDTTFGDMVMIATQGKGCDIIISCVKGECKNVSLNCCAVSGTTLDTQTVHSEESYDYGMYNMTMCRSYIATDFSSIFEPQNHAERKQLQLMVSDGIANGYIRPLSRMVYGLNEPAGAMRLLARSQHIGRVLLRIHGKASAASKRLSVQTGGSHLVVSSGSDDAVAVNIIDLLIKRGGVNVVLHREQITKKYDAYMNSKIKKWQNLGSKIVISSGPLHDKIKVEELIKVCNSLSPVDSILVIGTDKTDETGEKNIQSMLSNIDDLTRKSCSALRLFAIISNNADIGRDICINRVLDGFPALRLQYPQISKFDESNENLGETPGIDGSILLQNMMPVLENALSSSGPVSIVYMSEPEESLMNEDSQIRSEPPTGLRVLFPYIGTDELQATADMVFMETASQKGSMRDDEFDVNASFLVLVPGIDGHHGKFESLCQRLKLSAAVVQPGLDHIHESISEMAHRLVKVVLRRINPKQKFHLLGYSFGVLVALEMAAILEDQGLKGIVYCVDGSPDTFPAVMESWLREAGATDESRLQDAIVQHMYTLLTGSASEILATKLQEATSWTDKLEAVMQALRLKLQLSKQYTRSMIEAAYARIIETRRYQFKQVRPFRSQIVVLHSNAYPHTSPDLGLSRYFEQTPHVYNLGGTCDTILNNLSCANIINRHLDKKTLDDFHKKNLCNSYLLNSGVYSSLEKE